MTPFLGKLQQHGIIKIVFNPAVDEEPFVQLTKNGRQELFELFFPNYKKRKLNQVTSELRSCMEKIKPSNSKK